LPATHASGDFLVGTLPLPLPDTPGRMKSCPRARAARFHLRSRLPSRPACTRLREGFAQEGGFMPSTNHQPCPSCGRPAWLSPATGAKVDAAIESVIEMLEAALEP